MYLQREWQIRLVESIGRGRMEDDCRLFLFVGLMTCQMIVLLVWIALIS